MVNCLDCRYVRYMAANAKLSANVKAAAHMAQRRHRVEVYLSSNPDASREMHEPSGTATLDLELPNF